jgi:hypothetical protein
MKKLIYSLCILTAACFSTGLRSQQTWYFGNGGGMKFVNNVPSSFAQPAGTMSGANAAGEGSSVLMDASNNVIMFTNGRTIWNGSGVIQGTLNMLGGHSSSTQTALIVPIPSSSTPGALQRVFIFTVNCAENAYGNMNANWIGLRVSLATITGTAPNSTVTITPANQNILITPQNILMSERLSVTNYFVDDDGAGGYWVLAHGVGAFSGDPLIGNGLTNAGTLAQPGESSFYAYHITCETTSIALLDATEVESVTTAVTPHRSWRHPNGNDLNLANGSQINSQGQMKFSQNRTRVAVSLPWAGSTALSSGWVVNPVCQLFDFNENTGVVGGTNQVEFNLGFNSQNNNNKDGAAYGLEFSPSGRYLYISSTYSTGMFSSVPANGITTRIYRYNISSWTPGAAELIPGTAFVTTPNNGLGSYAAMQLGPDGRIYIARQVGNVLSRIDNPNNSILSTVGFVSSAVTISGTCMSGLPGPILVANTPSVPVISMGTSCAGSTISATGSFTGEAPSLYTWQLYTSNSAGLPVNSSNSVVSSVTSAAFYYSSALLQGSPGAFNFPGTSSLPCNRYYTAILTFTDICGEVVSTQVTSFRHCLPTPVISGGMVICAGTETSLCVNYPGTGLQPPTTIAWTPGGGSTSCIDVSPTTTTTYTVAVTQYGCTGTATATVTVTPNYTDMSVSTNLPSTNALYYTAVATPIPDPQTIMNGDPSFGFAWTVRELDPVTEAVLLNTSVWNPECWWAPTNANNFKGYVGGTNYDGQNGNNTGTGFNGTASNPNTYLPGQFQNGHKYRIEYSTWSNTCSGVTANYVMYVCGGGCRTTEPEIVFQGYTPYTGPHTMPGAPTEFNVLPNPSTGIFALNFTGTAAKNIVVYDVVGKIIFEKNSLTDATLTLDLSNEPAGVYFVKVITNGEIISKKIIKE